MICVICKHGETKPGLTRLTLERKQSVLVLHGVPADICENCGEAYLRAVAVDRALTFLDEAQRRGTEFEVRAFAAA